MCALVVPTFPGSLTRSIEDMMPLDDFLAYCMILFIATITPGPNMLLATNHGVNYGLSRTVYSGLGNLAGNLLLALVSILGLGAVLMASGVVFNAIKWIGVLYLMFVGVRMVFGPVSRDISKDESPQDSFGKRGYELFADGFVIAIGNPKGILFFSALFPQFIRTSHATVGSFLIIFIALGIIGFGCYMLYAVFGARLNVLLKMHAYRRMFNRITGSVLIGTGLAIAFSKR
jgi:threonine/homoserine/homoserine lactone efflux protein